MCTLSWIRGEEQLLLLFNRDEQRARGPELPPAALERAGVRFLAPRDADFGGTWLLANELGVAVCLLNGSPAHDPGPAAALESRGHLVLELADLAAADEAAARLDAERAARHRPFVLVALDDRGGAHVLEWDGRELSVDGHADARTPLCSSSFDEPVVRARRAALYRATFDAGRPPDADALHAWHASHDGGPSAYSVCMHREDAETRSFVTVRLAPGRVSMRYAPGPPCRTEALPELALPRRTLRAAERGR